MAVRTYSHILDIHERRGVNIIEGLDEALPTIGLRFDTPGRRASEPVTEMAQTEMAQTEMVQTEMVQ